MVFTSSFGVLQGFLSVKRTKEDMDAFVYNWRVMGFMLGIKDEYSLCTDSVDTTIIRSRTVLNEFLMAGLINPTNDFLHMTRYMVDGLCLWCLEPTLKYESICVLKKKMNRIRKIRKISSDTSAKLI
jgi:hypothetical protein